MHALSFLASFIRSSTDFALWTFSMYFAFTFVSEREAAPMLGVWLVRLVTAVLLLGSCGISLQGLAFF